MATSVQDVRQASYPGYSDDYTITKSQLSATGTLSGSGLPPTIPTLPQLPPNEPRRNWVPDPCAPWVDPSAPQSSIRPRTLVLCFDGTGDQFDDDVRTFCHFVIPTSSFDLTIFGCHYRIQMLSNSLLPSKKTTNDTSWFTTRC